MGAQAFKDQIKKIDLGNCVTWTRSAESWEDDVKIFQSLKMEQQVLQLPCVRTIPVLPDRFKKTNLAKGKLFTHQSPAFVFTSAKAVEFAMHLPHILDAMKASSGIFCIGQKTLAHLKHHGFSAIHPNGIDSGYELSQVVGREVDKETPIVLPGAIKRAYDMEMDLLNKGFKVQKLDLYQTTCQVTDSSGAPLVPEVVAELESTLGGSIVFGSPSAVEGFTSEFDVEKMKDRLVAIALGVTTAKAVKEAFGKVQIAEEPSFESSAELALKIIS